MIINLQAFWTVTKGQGPLAPITVNNLNLRLSPKQASQCAHFCFSFWQREKGVLMLTGWWPEASTRWQSELVLQGKPTGSGEFQETLCPRGKTKQTRPPPRTESPEAESPSISDTINSLESQATELRLSGSPWERHLICSHRVLFVFKTGFYYVVLAGLEITM